MIPRWTILVLVIAAALAGLLLLGEKPPQPSPERTVHTELYYQVDYGGRR